MKKLSKFLVLLSAFGLGIAGCGETKESPAVSTPEESTPAASTPAESTPAESTPDASTPAESTPAVNEALQEAADYFYQIYKDQKISLQDYDLIAKVQGYDIEYVLTVKSGIEDNVSIALGDDGKYHVTVKYNIDDSTEDTVYELLAKIKDGEDVVEVKFERTVPQYKFTTYDEYVAAAKAGSKDVLNVKAYVTSRMDFSSSSKTSMYLQDADGHGYYVYKPNIDSSIDSNEKMAEAFPTGAEVLISGQAVIYSGQYEFTQGASVKLTGQTIESLPYKDVTEAFKNAKNNKDDSLIEYQNARVTLRNVKLGV